MQIKKRSFLSIGFLSLLLVALLLSFLSFKNTLNEKLQEDIYQSLSNTSTQHKFFFHCRLEREINILKTLASCTPTDSAIDDKFMFSMMDQLIKTSDFQCFALVETDGTRVTNDGMHDNVAGLDVFQQAMKGNYAVSQPMDSIIDGVDKKIILMAYPVIEGNKTVRCIFGAYEVEQLSSVLLNTVSKEGFTTIINADGEIIIPDHNISRFGVTQNIFDLYQDAIFANKASVSEIKQHLQEGIEGAFSYSLEGKYNIAYYQPVGVNDWYVLSVAPESVVNEQAAGILKIVNSLTFKVIILFLALALFIFIKIKIESRHYKAKSEKDSMTGLYNKFTTEKLIDDILHHKTAETHALFLFDIDNFKGINDQFGHLIGDAVIQKVAEILNSVFRENDIVGRIGGDEFAVLLKNIKDESLVNKKAQEIISALEEVQLGHDVSVTCSIGISISKIDGNCFSELYLSADKALYEAKNLGKNRFCVHSNN